MVDPDLWIMAAKCEMEDRNSSESARHLFLRALRFHPENKKVYQEVSDRDVSHGRVQIKALIRFTSNNMYSTFSQSSQTGVCEAVLKVHDKKNQPKVKCIIHLF